MNKINAKELLTKLKNGTISAAERQLLEDWYDSYVDQAPPFDNVEAYVNDMKRLDAALPTILTPKKKTTIIYRYSKVAAAAIILAIGIYGLTQYRQSHTINEQLVEQELLPGGNRATLTLADGKRIDLSNKEAEIIINDETVSYANGKSIWTGDNKSQTLILSTPKGGQYQVTLADGTKVWLNAASTLRYPVQFAANERRVELEGEAYFEVAKNKKATFTVQSAKQEVAVLGTHFNIKAYNDEAQTKTTLLEGKVRVSALAIASNSLILQPGQQSSITATGQLQVASVDIGAITAWKENLFVFHDTELPAILQELSRWYNFNLDSKNIPNKKLYGEIPKDIPLSEVLKTLTEISGYQFKLLKEEGNPKERRLVWIKE